MPTQSEWENALRVPRVVTLESSPALLYQVREKQDQRDARLTVAGRTLPHRKPILAAPLGGQPFREILVDPIRLLHRLGVITTPPIDNLADLCSTWAYIRYLWAFSLPRGVPRERLCLSNLALSIDFHQKALMSDQIGVGMAALVMEELFNAPLAADVDVAMNDATWSIDLVESTSPDYLFFNQDQTILYVVECKGTRCSRNDAVDQLRRGTEQVPSLQFLDGSQPTYLVIGTQLRRTGVEVLIIDPPADESGDGGEKHGQSPRSGERPVRVSAREWRIPDSKIVERAARHVSQAKILSYAAADEAALAKIEQIGPRVRSLPRSTPRATILEENEFGRFSGIRRVLPFPDKLRVEIFQGVEESIRQAYIDDDIDRIVEESANIRKRRTRGASAVDHVGQVPQQIGHTTTMRSMSNDGTVFEVRLTPS